MVKMILKIFLIALWLVTGDAFMGSDRVRLQDISALTLHQGHMTTGRRSSPVPQLKCVGGLAAQSFKPQTVQCRNVGFDGYDVQWECKADMDDSYRFGDIQVSCEGYEYPEDEYILKGSCGLEYKLEYTDAGRARQNSYGGGSNYVSNSKHGSDTSGSWFLFFIVVGAVVFLICKMGSNNSDFSQNPNQPFRSGHHNTHSRNNPPPYGFKPEYTQQGQDYCPPPTYADSTTAGAHSTTTNNASPVGGFWSGMGLGSLAGYMFGSRRRNYGYGYGNSYSAPRGYGWGGNRGWGGAGGYGSSGWGSSSWGSGSTTTYRRSGGSSGTSRTASGFGGTTRR